MRKFLEQLYSGSTLSRAQAKELLNQLVDEGSEPLQIAAVLSALRMRQISIDEIHGFREGAMERCVKLDFSDFEPIDVCGTGGDGKSTFNISTLVAITVASCGVPVAKHGGGAVSSKCGSSDLLQALGYKFTTNESILKKQLEAANICFLHAPLFHPSFKNVAPVRKAMGVKTLFNILGPLCNPADLKSQLLGVYNLDLVRLYTFLGQRLGKNYTVAHSLDGCDEISLTSQAKISAAGLESILQPRDFGFEPLSYSELDEGKSLEESVSLFNKIASGQGTRAQSSVVVANAALALQTAQRARGMKPELLECVSRAQEALESGTVYQNFKKVVEIS